VYRENARLTAKGSPVNVRRAAAGEESLTGKVRWITGILLVAAIVGGAWLRLDGLTDRTMGHSEIYVPGVELPADHGEPRNRTTLARTVTNSLWEPHPPGWYVAMWGWTRVFGEGLFSIRFPSVLFGLGCVLLTWRLGARDGRPAAALAAAVLLAVHGHQIYWAQVARPSTMIAFLGLASTVLLHSAARRGGRGTSAAYLGVSAIGLVVDYYFWLLFAAHIFWSLADGWRDRPRALALLRLQMTSVILASPMVTLSIFQSRGAHFERDLLNDIRDFLQLGFLFTAKSPVLHRVPEGLPRVLAPLGILLLGLGLLPRTPPREETPERAVAAPGPALIGLLTAIVVAGILGASAVFLRRYAPDKAHVLYATAALPVIAYAVFLLARSADGPFARIWSALAGWAGVGSRRFSLVTTMALVPAGLTIAATFVFPLFVARHVLAVVPYLLIVMAGGVVWFARQGAAGKIVAVAIGVVVATAATVSVGWYSTRIHSPEDYGGLAREWIPSLREGDVLLLQDHWSTTPVFYYIDHRQYRILWGQYAEGLEQEIASAPELTDRVWTLELDSFPVRDDIAVALAGRMPVEAHIVRGIRAVRYAPESPSSP
jgi:4-amino-4-deoxy-L-arabinose transferase-like glycosyltransferase